MKADRRQTGRLLATLTCLAIESVASSARAQDACRFVCTPVLKVEPTLTFSNVFDAHLVRPLPDGQPRQVSRQRAFEMIVAVDIPTEVPRLGFTVESIWTLPDSPVELEFETNLIWLPSTRTGGWLSSHFDIVDKYSPGQRPRDSGAYTHKLNLELDTAVSLFNRLEGSPWLRRLELEGSLDYVATGLPRAGDVIDGEQYLSGASRWSFSLVFVIPIAPPP